MSTPLTPWTHLGIDIGGTKTHAALATAEEPTRPALSAKAGSANVQNVSREAAAAAIDEIAASLDAQDPQWRTGLERVAVGAGGVDTEQDAANLRDLLAERLRLEASLIDVVHDTRLIIAAAGHLTGISLILGTGSVAWGQNDDGRSARAGGWGYLLGDEGSAYWFGREAVREVLAAGERGEEEDPLIAEVLSAAGVSRPEELIAAFYENPSRTHWAGLARCVFEAERRESALAEGIIAEGLELMTDMVSAVADRLAIEGPVVCGGGLIQNQPGLAARLRESLEADGITPMEVLDVEPVVGALFLAAQKN